MGSQWHHDFHIKYADALEEESDEQYIQRLLDTGPRIQAHLTNITIDDAGIVSVVLQARAWDEPVAYKLSMEEGEFHVAKFREAIRLRDERLKAKALTDALLDSITNKKKKGL